MRTRRWVLAGGARLLRRFTMTLGLHLRRRTARVGLIVVAVLALAAHSAAGGPLITHSATGGPLVTHPAKGSGRQQSPLSNTFISFSPVRNARRETLALTAYGCARNQEVSALYSQRRGRAELFHDYTGTVTSCQLNRRLTAGTLTVRWSTALRVAVALRAVAQPQIRRVRVAPGCYETTARVKLVATGTFDAAVHAARLGRMVRSRLRATLENFVLPSCVFGGATGSLSTIATSVSAGASGTSTTELLRGDQLEAIWGANDTLGAVAARGERSRVTFSESADDGPTPTVSDTFGLTLTGGGGFTPASDLEHATLDFASPLSQGTLTFTAGIGCPPTIRAEDGTFTGTVTIDDPVLGTVRFSGDVMSQGQLSVVAADADKCAPANFGEA